MMDREQFLKNLTVPTGVVDAILDTDAAAEIDDQFAIAYFMLSPERIRPVGMCAAPVIPVDGASSAVGMERSYEEILKILRLMGREDFYPFVYRGADRFMKHETDLIPSHAANFMVETARAHSPENPLYIIGIGAITNIASAFLLDPVVMAKNTVVIWLGGHAHHWEKNDEYNLIHDMPAARIVFSSNVPLVQLPCEGVVSSFCTTGPELKHHLEGTNPLGDYLVSNTLEVAEKYMRDKAWSRCIWDVTAVAWLLNDGQRFLRTRRVPTPIPQYDFTYSFPENARPMEYVYRINRDKLFSDLFERIARL